MSLFFTYFNDDEAYVSADSRCSIEINGKRYINGDVQKHTIINNMIITYGGVMQFCLVVLETFRQFPVELQNIDNLARTARMIWNNKDKYIDLWHIGNLDSRDRVCDFRVTYFDKEDSIMKHATLIYDNNYEPTIFKGEPRYQLAVNGFDQEKAHEHLVATAGMNRTIKEWFLDGYNNVSSECVGGIMTLIHIVKDKIVSQKLCPITDSKDCLIFDAITTGTIAKHAMLGGLNNKSIITYIDSKTGTTENYTYTDIANGSVNTDDIYAAIQGRHISCAGLHIEKTTNGVTRSFDINEDAKVTMKNSDITMTGTNSKGESVCLNISPENFLQWVINNEPKFYYDQTNNALVFGGTIDTLEDVKVGETIVVRDSNGGDGLVISAKGGMTGDSITITANSGRYIDIKTSLARLNGERILTTVDIDNIKSEIQEWTKENFAPKVTTNPITPLG